MEKQKTIAREVIVSGKGLHSGNVVKAVFRPAPEDAGVVFFRVDLPGKPAIKAAVDNVHPKSASMRYSFIEKDGVQVATIEHLLAALAGLGIDNLYIELDAAELPGCDGSSLEFVETLSKAGIKEQEAQRHYITIREPVFIEENGACIIGLPAPALKISYTLDYNHPKIGSDLFQICMTPEAFAKEIAPARTFCLEQEVEELRKAGLGKGASEQNALVVGTNGVIGNKMRFPDEFVRHKVLDLAGDLNILGRAIKGQIIAIKSGHSLNLKFVRKLAEVQKETAAIVAGSDLPAFGEKLDVTQIMQILPHRQPFLLVDKIIHLELGKRVIGVKNVTMNENFFEGHFPGKPVMPGVLILEAMAQVGGVMMLAMEENKGKIAYFMAINNAKFRKMVVPGDQLVFEVTAQKVKSRTGIVHGTASVDGKVVAEADLMFSLGE
ncbi:MAG: bifunctional UDP-3-O-[3-hydroxymyristoyl] N-acetylglucosamine deacetylase/3-hydroxyacyl-ACP dehydratase [Deltaproteobacteria bacterium]